MELLQGEEVPQRKQWPRNGLSTTHPVNIRMNYLGVSLNTSDNIWKKSEGHTKNQESPISISVKQQVPPATLVNKGDQIEMRVGRIPCEPTPTVFKSRMVQWGPKYLNSEVGFPVETK